MEELIGNFEKYRPYRFVLKVWLLVQANDNDCIRWLDNKTRFVVNKATLLAYLRSDSSIFNCRSLENFCWLMNFYGFEVASRVITVADWKPEDCLTYQHHTFTGANRAYFEHLLRQRKLREGGNCATGLTPILRNEKTLYEGTGPASAELSCFREMMERKQQELMKAISSVYQSISSNPDSDSLIEIPAEYSDVLVCHAPEYMETGRFAGNYGDVRAEDIRKFYGHRLPMGENSNRAESQDSSGNVATPAEEQKPATTDEDEVIVEWIDETEVECAEYNNATDEVIEDLKPVTEYWWTPVMAVDGMKEEEQHAPDVPPGATDPDQLTPSVEIIKCEETRIYDLEKYDGYFGADGAA